MYKVLKGLKKKKLKKKKKATTKYSDCIILLFTEMWSEYNN